MFLFSLVHCFRVWVYGLINVSEFWIKPAKYVHVRVARLRARMCVETAGKAYTVSKLIIFGVHVFVANRFKK